MKDWKIVKSKSDMHPEFGYPLGEVLCRDLEEAEDFIKRSEFKDCYIENYSYEDEKKAEKK